MNSSNDSSNKVEISDNHFNSAKTVVSKWAEWKKEYANCSSVEMNTKSNSEN